jgi:two-component system, NtrC family, sensor kinase
VKQIVFLLIFFSINAFAQKSDLFVIDTLPTKGLLLDKGWKYQTGDNLDWANPEFNDTAWTAIDPTLDIIAQPAFFNAQVKWLRFDFEVKNKLPNPLGIAINQAGASEIYLNGRLIHRFGQFDTDSNQVKAYDPLEVPIYFPADTIGHYQLAVRYALQPNVRYTKVFGQIENRIFYATIVDLIPTLKAQKRFKVYRIGLDIFSIGIFVMLFVLHLAFYIYQQTNKTHLLVAAYVFCTASARAFRIIGQNQSFLEDRYVSLNIGNLMLGLVLAFMCIVYYRMAKVRLDGYFYALIAFNMAYILVSGLNYGFPWHSILLLVNSIFSFIVVVRLTSVGFKKRTKGFLILGGAVSFAIFGLVCITVATIFLNYGISPNGHNDLKYGISPYLIDAIFGLSSICIPIGLSLFMGIESRETNQELSKQLSKNEQLKNDAIKLEQEKQHLLATQNETLEKQVTERTAELNQSLVVLKAMQSQLIQSEKLASLGELTAGISHEIQNPLNFVTNFSELSIDLAKDLKEEIDRTELDKEYVGDLLADLTSNQEKINFHGKRASSIVKGMLDHSRTSAGVKELVDINKLADEYLRLSFHGLRAKDKKFNADFTTDFSDSNPKIEVVAQDFGRVILNLINNAFYAVNQRKLANQADSTYQPLVTVTTLQIDNQLIIKIRDNGTGMPESVKAKIFQPFFTTKPTGEGTGLGLSLSHDIVTKGHGGTLEVDSTEGVGTTFIVTLPLISIK